MDVSKGNDNKSFRNTVKPRFSNKCKTENIIIVTEGDTIMNNEKLIAEIKEKYDIQRTHFHLLCFRKRKASKR